MNPIRLCLALFALIPAWTCRAEELKPVTEPLGILTKPFAFALDFKTFNPPEGEKSDEALGEILSLYDEFLEAQGIPAMSSPESLDRIEALVLRDYGLAKARESALDEQYDALKEDLEKREDDLLDRDKKADLGAYLDLKAEADALKSGRKLLRSYVDFEKPLLEKIGRAKASPQDSRLRKEASDMAARILYSLFADQYLSDSDDDPLQRSPREKRQLVKHFVCRADLNATRYFTPHTRNCPVGRLGATKEATNLVDRTGPVCFRRAVGEALARGCLPT